MYPCELKTRGSRSSRRPSRMTCTLTLDLDLGGGSACFFSFKVSVPHVISDPTSCLNAILV
jgi:hypothetical protein